MIVEEQKTLPAPAPEEVSDLAYNFQYEEALAGFMLALRSGRPVSQFASSYSLHGVVRGAYRRIMSGTAPHGTPVAATIDAALTAYRALESLETRSGFTPEYYKAGYMTAGLLLRSGREQEAWAVIDEVFENGVERNPHIRIACLLLRVQLLRLSGKPGAAFDLAESLVERPFQIIDAAQIAELNILYGRLCKELGRLAAFTPVMWRGLRVTRGNAVMRNRTLESLVEIYGTRNAVRAMAAPGSIEETILHFAWAATEAGRAEAEALGAEIDALLEGRNYGGPRAQHEIHFSGSVAPLGRQLRVLVTRGVGGIGDLLMMTPGIRALRQMNPGSEILFAVPGNLVAPLAGNPDCTVVDIGAEDLDVRDFDVWYNLSDCPASRHECRTAPVVTRSRIELFAEGMGVTPEELTRYGRTPVYVVSEDERRFARGFLSERGPGPFIAVQLQAADRYRDYPHLEAVVKALAERFDVLVFNDRPFSGFQYERVTRVHGLPLRKAFALVSLCDAVLAPDSSFVHLAGALDIPCVALFGPIDGRMRTQDYPRCIALDASAVHECLPCWRDEFTKCRVTDGRRSQCMADIDPGRVVQTLIDLRAKEIESCPR